MKKIIATVWFLIFLSCGDSRNSDVVIPSGDHAVFIVCEGNYGSLNASLSVFDSVEYDTSFRDVYEPVNGNKLGDYAHHMCINDSLGYICVTGSNKVEVINLRNFHSMQTIKNIRSPRQSAVYQSKLLVTSFTDSALLIIDIPTAQKETTIKLPMRPNEIQLLEGKAFISCGPLDNDTMIAVIDLTAANTMRTLPVGQRPAALAADTSRKLLMVACEGVHRDSGCIALVNAQTETVIRRIGQSEGIHPVKITAQDSLIACIISDNGPIRIYNLLGAVLKSMSTGFGFYALEIHNGELFAAEGGDFISSGQLIWFNSSYAIKKIYPVGIAPGAIIFQ